MNFNISDALILIFLGKSLNYVVFVKFCVRDSDPLGRRLACKAPLQEPRGRAVCAHVGPCNIARPAQWRGKRHVVENRFAYLKKRAPAV